MRPSGTLALAVALLAAPGRTQTGYTYTELIPWSYLLGPSYGYPLYDRAFTSGTYFSRVAADPLGNVFVTDGRTAQKITPRGEMIPIAGYGAGTISPGERLNALLTAPGLEALAADSHGNLYAGGANGVTRITPDGMIEPISPQPTSSIAIDGRDNLYVLIGTTQIVRIAPDGSQSIVAGDGGPATSAAIDAFQIAADAAGTLWLAETNRGRIRKVALDGIITTVAETASPYSIAADSTGNLYFAAWDSAAVHRLAPSGAITDVAVPASYRGVGGLAVDSAGNLYIAELRRLLRVDAAGQVSTVAGCVCSGDGVPFWWARVEAPMGLALDSAGNIYFSDQPSNLVRRIARDGTITTIAGTGEAGFSGDGGPAREARLNGPAGLNFDSAGNLYIADEQNNRIRKVTPAGIISTVAGNGESAVLGLPDGVAVDAAGNVYIADTANHRIHRVTPDGVMRTIAGSDQYGSAGDGGPALQATLINPRSLIVDAKGNLLLVDSSARVVRRITPAGIIERVAGTGERGTGGDGGPAINAQFDLPWSIALDPQGNVLVGDSFRIRRIDANGTITTAAQGTAKGLAVDPAGVYWMATGNTVAAGAYGALPFAPGPVISPEYIGSATRSNPFLIIPSAAVAPGEIIAIPGQRLGPDSYTNASPASTTVAGVRVLFDEIPAQVLAVFGTQVTAIVPYGVAGRDAVTVTVEVNGVRSNPARLAVLPSVPALFNRSYGTLLTVAALNQDGRPNGPDNPAELGSVVSMFVNGAGAFTPATKDGEIISGPPFPAAALPVQAMAGGRPLELLYAGAIPGFVSGGLQVNVRLPADVTPGTLPFVQPGVLAVTVLVGDAKTESAYIFVNRPASGR